MDAIGRAWLSLDGLSVGDAFGERFFTLPELALERISRRELPAAPWTYTDDTEMALSIVEILIERGSIDQDLLAKRFADRMQPDRHYGPGTEALLAGLKTGREWRRLSKSGHGGKGSFGNGAAMRVAPLGAGLRRTAETRTGEAAPRGRAPGRTARPCRRAPGASDVALRKD